MCGSRYVCGYMCLLFVFVGVFFVHFVGVSVGLSVFLSLYLCLVCGALPCLCLCVGGAGGLFAEESSQRALAHRSLPKAARRRTYVCACVLWGVFHRHAVLLLP